MTNEPQPTRLTREELYEKVWHCPVAKLAQSFGVSDAAIHKACEKHAVPKPPRGYWAQRAFGKEVEGPPLEPVVDPELNNVVIGQQIPTTAERDRMKKYPAFHGVPEKDSKLSGELLLGLDDQYTSGI